MTHQCPLLPMLRDPRFPNVLPEGTEDNIGVVAIRVPGRNTRVCQAPALALCPGVLEAKPAEAIGRVGVGVYPLYPNPAAEREPQQVCDLNCSLGLGEEAATTYGT